MRKFYFILFSLKQLHLLSKSFQQLAIVDLLGFTSASGLIFSADTWTACVFEGSERFIAAADS